MPNATAYLDESTGADWSRILYDFLAEKEWRSGFLRTVQSYSRMLNDFFRAEQASPILSKVRTCSAGPTAPGLEGEEDRSWGKVASAIGL